METNKNKNDAYTTKATSGINNIDVIERTLAEQGVKYVRIAFVDTSNILRFRIIPVARFLCFLQPGAIPRGVAMSLAGMGLLLYQDHLAKGLPPCISVVGEFCLVPDVKSLRRLPYGSGTHAICMADLQGKDYADKKPIEFGGCPRTCLKNIMARAERHGLSFLVGFESEVIFLLKLDPPTPIDNTTYCSSKAFHSIQTCQMVDEIVESISSQGIRILQFHSESAPGQFEFVTDAYNPIEAADALVLTRETIYNIAAKYNLKATFAPKVFEDFVGSGSHCHISVKGSNGFDKLKKHPNGPEGLSALEDRFMAGILKHMRAISAFTLPNVNSYARVQEEFFVGVYVGWGIDNREVPLRLAYTPALSLKDREFNFELKCVDGTANPYLAVASIISAGLDGILSDLPLTIKELTVSPSILSVEERFELGVTERLPSSVEEALSALQNNYDLFCEWMGKPMVDIFMAVHAEEAAHIISLSKSQQLKLVISSY